MTIVVIIVAIFLAVVIGFVILRSLLIPLKMIDRGSIELTKGNFDAHIDYEASDELGLIVASFNKTVAELKNYINYIDEISDVLNEIANGNLSFTLQYDYSGNFHKIKTAFEHISDTLNMTMNNINRSAIQVSTGSSQVSDGAQALAQGATEQASSIQQLAATITTISDNVTTNAGNAKRAREQAYSFGETIKQSNIRMNDMINSMAEITDTSNEIGKIIKLIDDIAFQTNILSLNAAVEAARAGVAGKGFAVVADEVRNLATKSAEAAKNTNSLIANSIKAVNNGTRIANDTAKILSSVVEETNELINNMDSIASASDSQADAVLQVKEGVDQISNVVQTNSATAEQSASISETLNSQANVLKNLVGKFKLKDTFQSYADPAVHDYNNYNAEPPKEIYLNEPEDNSYVSDIVLVPNNTGNDKY